MKFETQKGIGEMKEHKKQQIRDGKDTVTMEFEEHSSEI